MRTRQVIMPRRYSRMGIGGDGSTLNLNFAAMGALDTRFTFTRSTTATYINSSGYVATMAAAATNDPTKARFDYNPTTLAANGLLIEGSATNIVLYSQSINSSLSFLVGGSTTLTQNTTDVLDPAGGNTATKIALTASNYCSRAQIVAVSGSTQYTFSYYIRGTPSNQCRIYSYAGYAGDLVTSTDYTYTTNSWTRVTTTFTTNAATAGIYVYVCSRNSAASPAEVIYVWGAQLETGTGASSYIPTVASQVTRAADSCNIGTIAPFNYSTTNGTLFYSGIITKQNAASYPMRVGFYNTSDTKCFSFYTNANSLFFGAAGNATAETSKSYTLNTAFKAAMSLDASLSTSELIVNLNGSTGATGATALTATNTPNQFSFGQTGYELYFPCGTISAVKYWNTTKTAAELAALTA